MARHVKDKYVQASTHGDLRSRSAFKLLQMNEKYKFIRPNSRVIDLGSAPGGWSLSMSKTVKQSAGGRIIAVDLLPMDPIENVHFIQGDFTSPETQKNILLAARGPELTQIDVVVSDMLMNTCGHKETDHFRSMELLYSILDFTKSCNDDPPSLPSKPHKIAIVAKYYRGSDEEEMLECFREAGHVVKVVKPDASRKASREVYLLAQ